MILNWLHGLLRGGRTDREPIRDPSFTYQGMSREAYRATYGSKPLHRPEPRRLPKAN